MWKRLVDIKQDVVAVMLSTALDKKKQLRLTDSTWRLIENMLPVLEPLAESTEVLSSEEYPTVSCQHPLYNGICKNTLQPDDNDSVVVAEFKRVVKQGLKSRLQDKCDWRGSTAMKASVLDPRYKKLTFVESEDDRKLVGVKYGRNSPQNIIVICTLHIMITYNFQVYNDILSLLGNEEPKPSKVVKVEPLSECKDDPEGEGIKRPRLCDLFGGDVIEVDHVDPEIGGTEENFNQYIAENILVVKGNKLNPVEWWQKNEFRFPRLAGLARKYLAVPGTSVPSERAFSTTGLTITKQRANLGSSTVDAILFLNKNMRKTYVLQAENFECQSEEDQTSTVKTEVHMKEEPMESTSVDEQLLQIH